MIQEYNLIIDLISNVGGVGFIFLLFWKTTNHTIPRLTKSFENNLDKSRDEFREMLQQQRDDFREILREQRGQHG